MLIFKVTENKLYLKIISYDDDVELEQMQLSLNPYVDNFYFKKKKFHGHWNGKISFIDDALRIPVGLWFKVQQICEQYNIPYQFENLDVIFNNDFDEKDFDDWVINFFKDNPDIDLRDYQIEAAKIILKYQRSISEIATSGGKTLIMFMVFGYLKFKNQLNRMLVIVPTVDLVVQNMEKFVKYSENYSKLKFTYQLIYSDETKEIQNVDVVFGTYQSLCKLPDNFFTAVNVICNDESQFAQTKSIESVIKKCINAPFRFGMSGTAKIDKDVAEAYTIMGLLGPMINKIKAHFLFENNYATPVQVKMLYLDYIGLDVRAALKKLKATTKKKKQEGDNSKKETDGAKLLGYERDIILSNEKRFDYIIDFISNLKKNTLVLFQDIKRSHGKNIYNKLKEIFDSDYEIFYIDGQTPIDNRKYYREAMDNKDDKIRVMVASFGCFSTGIDVNNIHYILLVESYKSETIIKQSVGRGMRLDDDKDIVTIIDFIDDFSMKGFDNYFLKHSVERERIYKEERYKIKKYKIQF